MRSLNAEKNFLVGKAGWTEKIGVSKAGGRRKKKALGPILEFLKSGRGRMQARGEREREKESFKKKKQRKNDQAGEDLLNG